MWREKCDSQTIASMGQREEGWGLGEQSQYNDWQRTGGFEQKRPSELTADTGRGSQTSRSLSTLNHEGLQIREDTNRHQTPKPTHSTLTEESLKGVMTIFIYKILIKNIWTDMILNDHLFIKKYCFQTDKSKIGLLVVWNVASVR